MREMITEKKKGRVQDILRVFQDTRRKKNEQNALGSYLDTRRVDYNHLATSFITPPLLDDVFDNVIKDLRRLCVIFLLD